MRNGLLNILFITVAISCKVTNEVKTIGSIERIDPSLDNLIHGDARIEILADGYEWSEGPVWIESKKMLLFSDVPKNTIYRWTEKDGVSIYLTPSGYTGTEPSKSREPGSNGLALDNAGRLVVCQHGDRRVARLDASFDDPAPVFITLADRFGGKRFNSPNDADVRKNGDIFFTDPPYGLPEHENDPEKELAFQGVYKIAPSGEVSLLVDSLTRPNGIAFTPDEKTFIVANSDPAKAIWYAFDLTDSDSVINARVFHDATVAARTDNGLPDGLTVDQNGNVFATGPGGVWIFDSKGKVLGRIRIPAATANCELANDDQTLFLTADNYLLRIILR